MLATFLRFHTAMQLDEPELKNIVNVLHEAKFSDSDWAQLGLQLIQDFDSKTIRANHDGASDRMIETISQWLRTDTAKSWEKLAEAVTKVVGYGEAAADIVRQNAHKCMLTVVCLMINI